MKNACLFLLAGVYAPQLNSFESYSDLFVVAMFGLLAAWIIGRPGLAIVLIAGCILFLQVGNNLVDARISRDFAGDSIVTVVRIDDFPRRKAASVSLVGNVPDNPWVPEQILISWHAPGQVIQIGDVWQLELRLRRPRGNSNPGAFDYETWLFREGVAATGYVVDGPRNLLLRRRELGRVDKLRVRVVERLAATVKHPERVAVLAALSVGARHLVTPEQWQRYAQSGTSHLMAISGLHIGMVAAAGYLIVALLVGMARLRGNQHFVSTVAALFAATAYALLSGMAVPAQRAALMIGIAAVAVLARRQVRPVTVVASACALIVLLSPLASMAPGFKLSFSAVLVLIWIARRSPALSTGSLLLRPLLRLRQLGAIQVLLLFGLMPLTAMIFARISLAAPAVNLVAVPVFSLVTVPFTLAGLMFDGPLLWLGDRALLLAVLSLDFVEQLIAHAVTLPAASVNVPELDPGKRFYLLLPLCWVLLPPAWPGRHIALIAALALIVHEPARPAHGCADVDVLDVGQGLAVVITTQHSVLLFDTGPAFRSGGSAMESVVLPFLAHRGIKHIDNVVVSHADLDHAGGVDALLRRMPVGLLHVGEPLGDARPGRLCDAGQYWLVDGVRFDMLHPRADTERSGNNASCVLQLSAGEHRLLLTGDIESPAEAALSRSGDLQPVDAVVVPHHGSGTSSGTAFVQALRPSVAIVSAGFDNRWGLPKSEVVERWQGAGAAVHVTATTGAISMRLCEQGGIVFLARHRVERRRIWHE